MSDLWVTASQDQEADEHIRAVAAARVQTAEHLGFLLGASSERDFDNRLFLTLQRVALADGVRDEIVASWQQDFIAAKGWKTAAQGDKGVCRHCNKPIEEGQMGAWHHSGRPANSWSVLCDDSKGLRGAGETNLAEPTRIKSGALAVEAFHTITQEYTGKPEPQHVVRRYGDKFEKAFPTRAEAEQYVKDQGSTVGTPDKGTEEGWPFHGSIHTAVDVKYDNLWACPDCTMLIANGETPPENTEEQDAEYLNNIAKIWGGEQTHAVLTDDEDDFSMSRCDYCGSNLGGSRHSFVVLGGLRHTASPGTCPNCSSGSVVITGNPLGGPGNPTGRMDLPSRSRCKDCGHTWSSEVPRCAECGDVRANHHNPNAYRGGQNHDFKMASAGSRLPFREAAAKCTECGGAVEPSRVDPSWGDAQLCGSCDKKIRDGIAKRDHENQQLLNAPDEDTYYLINKERDLRRNGPSRNNVGASLHTAAERTYEEYARSFIQQGMTPMSQADWEKAKANDAEMAKRYQSSVTAAGDTWSDSSGRKWPVLTCQVCRQKPGDAGTQATKGANGATSVLLPMCTDCAKTHADPNTEDFKRVASKTANDLDLDKLSASDLNSDDVAILVNNRIIPDPKQFKDICEMFLAGDITESLFKGAYEVMYGGTAVNNWADPRGLAAAAIERITQGAWYKQRYAAAGSRHPFGG